MKIVERLDNEEFRYIMETKNMEYYVSNELRVISKSKLNGNERELKEKYNISKTNRKRMFVKIGNSPISVARLAYKAFIDPNIEADDIIYCDGDLELENLKKGKQSGMKHKVIVNGVVYDSVKECAKQTGICYSSVSRYLSGTLRNKLNVKYVEDNVWQV